MDIKSLIEICTVIVITFNKKGKNMQGFEMLVYEQACRMLEDIFKDFRKTQEEHNAGPENY